MGLRFRKNKAIFNDMSPYIEMVRPLVTGDFEIQTKQGESRPEEALQNTYSRYTHAQLYIIPSKDLQRELENAGINLESVFKYNNYISSEQDIYHLSKSLQSDNVKFTGMRGDEKKKQKYLKMYQDFNNDFKSNYNKYVSELMKLANEKVQTEVKRNNEKYVTEHIDLFTDVRYSDAWDKDWNADQNIQGANKEIDSYQEKINALNVEVKKLKNKIHDKKLDIVKQDFEKYKSQLPDSVVSDIQTKLDSGKAFKERTSLSFG